MTQDKRQAEDEGIPPFDEAPPLRPSDDDQETILPADRPLASRDRMTVSEQLAGESLRERVAREEPEIQREDVEPRETPGRFYSQPERDIEATETRDHGGLSPEEAAMRAEEEDPV